MEFRIEGLIIRDLLTSDINSLQKLFEGSKDYTKLIEGRNPQPGDAEDLLKALPEGKSLEDKFVLGVYDAGSLVGIIDLIKNYPEEGVWFIGLLLLSPEYRTKGLGGKIYSALKNDLTTLNSVTAIRISVAEQNTQALGFWKKLGFKDLYSKLQNRGNLEARFMYLEDKLNK